ncbi:AMP-binding enzyme [Variovorax boronicumulans]|uniref:AMP-binding enzyme n=1 Tax=Variovorax boronicumulans TaxID=436515 RepID=UPI00351E597B
MQAELAAELGTRIQRIEGHRSPHTIATNLRIYLEAATQEGLRQLILVDGPVVLGWERWRGIDDRHFMDSIRTGLVAIMPAGTPPEEIEAATRLIAGAVAEAALAIQEACVIATRDAYRGESVKALVVLRPAQAPVSAQDIIDWCAANMAAYKAPRVVQFVDALPKSGSGKVMWRALQEAEAAST